jgi:hypothetical protein
LGHRHFVSERAVKPRRFLRRRRAEPVAVARDPAAIEIALRERFPQMADHDRSLAAWWMADLSRELDVDPLAPEILERTNRLLKHYRHHP